MFLNLLPTKKENTFQFLISWYRVQHEGAECSWPRHWATSHEFDSRWGNWIFHWLNPSSHTMALGTSESLTEISTRIVSWGGGKGNRCVGLPNLPPSSADCLEILEALPSCSPYRPFQACKGIASPLPLPDTTKNFYLVSSHNRQVWITDGRELKSTKVR